MRMDGRVYSGVSIHAHTHTHTHTHIHIQSCLCRLAVVMPTYTHTLPSIHTHTYTHTGRNVAASVDLSSGVVTRLDKAEDIFGAKEAKKEWDYVAHHPR